MKYLLLMVAVGLCPVGAGAQTVLPFPGDSAVRPVTIKFGITSLLGPDATVTLGAELPVGNHKAWQIEGGYGWFNSLYNVDKDHYAHSSVWQVRTEFRWYGNGHFPEGVMSRSLGPYYAVEVAGKQINVRDQATVGRDCVGFTCGYFEKIDQPVTRYTITGLLKAGWQLPFYDKKERVRFVADIYVGMGAGYAWTTRAPLTANGSAGTDVYYNQPGFLEFKDRFAANYYHGSLDVIVGVKLGYRLRAQ